MSVWLPLTSKTMCVYKCLKIKNHTALTIKYRIDLQLIIRKNEKIDKTRHLGLGSILGHNLGLCNTIIV